MTTTDKLTIPATVMMREVGDETVLLDFESGTYFGLDTVGTRVWQLIVAGLAFEELKSAMLEEYDVESQVLEGDLDRLIGDLKKRGLVVEVSEPVTK